MQKLFASATTATLLLALFAGSARAEPAESETSQPNAIAIGEPIPGGFKNWGDLFELQGRMNSAAAAIREAADQIPGNGYSNTFADPATRRLTIYWRGNMPPAVQQVIETERKSVPIQILPAQYSATQLFAAVQRLSKNPAFSKVSAKIDGSGVQISWASAQANDRILAEARSTEAVSLTEEADASGPTVVEFSRQDDASPYYAGAKTAKCTAGFAVNWNGNSRLLYAGHCGSNGNSVIDGGGGTMGNIINDNDSRDTAMIDARSWGAMWSGGWQSNDAKSVQGASFSNAGNWICTSGAVSGELCGIQVKKNNVSIGGKFPLVEAENPYHTSAAGQGDSGGPVYELPQPDSGKVIAKGVISSGDPSALAVCEGQLINRTCTWRFYYADVTQTLSFYGASIRTN